MKRACTICGSIVEATARYCDTHQALEDQRRRAKTRDHGVERPHFQALRKQRLKLANHRCELHLDDHCTGTATSVHIKPELEGNHDAATIDDCLAACAHCHGVEDGGRAHKGGGSPHLAEAHRPAKAFPREKPSSEVIFA